MHTRYPLKMDEREENKYFQEKILRIGLFKYVKTKALSFLFFLGKVRLLFAVFGLFLVENRVE